LLSCHERGEQSINLHRWFLNTVYQEVVSLPFNTESQGTISKNSFSCLLNIETCDRGVDRRTPFSGKVVKKLFLLPQM
ncbi:hypothetical protein ACFDDQ_14115, partial [Enterococcus lactis]|uniref:hypothetical protein n=1 Tax=Enterococcus lactis TaxID=357441 RepID=UPI0039A49267